MAERKKIRVLHLASFAGNIGDLANHAGARRKFSQNIDLEFDITELEIREFYWKQRQFDSSFVDYANSFDLLIIGGGNYFELWVENSATGTSIDIKPDEFAKLETPVMFYSLGADIGQGYSEHSATRFRSFIDTVLEREAAFVSVRNDGSKRALELILGAKISAKIPVIADGGFFCHEPTPKVGGATQSIGINIAGDMLDQRFNEGTSVKDFISGLQQVCTTLIDQNPSLRIDLIPHIWRDVVFISEFIGELPDPYLRRNVGIAPLLPTREGLPEFLQRYASYDLVLGMRFHANVCPIGMGVPTRGLYCYPQVKLLYEELGLEDRICDLKNGDFTTNLIETAQADLQAGNEIRARYTGVTEKLSAETDAVLQDVNTWLHSCL
ncbi:MAG: polysaccharide pyruvyl transferase family protein [Rhodobacteraceae bacterium]|nr:polysaccharide pyruvyl transferase family protein [Paracoccaceae bacterium]